jgi:hypothetical protein
MIKEENQMNSENIWLDSIDKQEVIAAIQKLNPDVGIMKASPYISPQAYEQNIYTSVSPENLSLPEPFYYNSKNGITNKHKTQSGQYTSIQVEPITPEMKETFGLVDFFAPEYEVKERDEELLNDARSKIKEKINKIMGRDR